MGLKRVRILAQRLSGIMCTSDYNMRFCTEILEVPAERLRLFPNAADDANFHPRDRAAVRRELGLPPETFIVLFSGHFDENKGAHRLLRALEAVPTARAIFLGDGPALPSNSRILHQGRVPHSEMPKWLSAADLFALPVLVEASSNAVAEAMACGLPIVTSDIPSMRLMVGFDAGKLIDPRDVNAIGDALRIFFEDPDLRARMAAAALQKARSYTLADRTAKIVGWFEDLTA
jgi:glycosyltransferase involved in cell wall biosynthesis